MGGWVPSNWYYYDNDNKTLFRPDGTQTPIYAMPYAGSFYLIANEDGDLVHIFDSTGKIVETKLGLTGQTIYSFYYDGAGRLAYINEPFSKVTTFNRNGSGVLTSITAPNGKVTTVTHDGNGYLETVTNPKSETYEMDYNGSGGLLTSFEKPSGVISTFTYDGSGNLTSDEHSGGAELSLSRINNADGSSTTTVTSKMNRQDVILGYASGGWEQNAKADGSIYYTRNTSDLTQKFHNGVQEQYHFNQNPRFGGTSRLPTQSAITKLSFRQTTTTNNISYSTIGDPFSLDSWTSVTKVGLNSYPKTWSYQNFGGVKEITTNAAGQFPVITQIDDYQRPVQVTRGNLYPVQYTYVDDKLTSISQQSRGRSFTYDPVSGLLASTTDYVNSPIYYTYDAAERLTKMEYGFNREILYTYDSRGNLTSITPQTRPAHTMVIGANEKISSYNPPTLSGVPNVTTTYSYNLDNQLTEVTRPDGQSIEYTYGSTTGRLETITVPGGDYEYTYGLLGSNISYPTKIEAPNNFSANLSYTNGVLSGVNIKDASNSTIYDYSITSTQHGQVNLDNLTAGTGSFPIFYQYNDTEELSQVGDVSLQYNTWGAVFQATLGNSVGNTYYNRYADLTEYNFKYNFSTLYLIKMTYWENGTIKKKEETINGNYNVYEYDYDSSGRLILVKQNGSTIGSYSYDANNNRTGGNNGTAITATYDDQDRMTAYKNHTFTYNANGDLTSKTHTPTGDTTTYTYDVFGNLTQVVTPTKTIVYEIDPLNRRVGKIVNGTLQMRYAYDMRSRLIAEINPAGNAIRRYVYASKKHIPDYFIESGIRYSIVSDNLGSVRLVVRETDGNIMQQMEHDEFGRIVSDSNQGYQPFGYAGGIWDHETGLIRFGRRDYDPMSGRWTAKDPIRFDGKDANLYSYVLNNPMNLIDIKGTSPDDNEDPLKEYVPNRIQDIKDYLETLRGTAKDKLDTIKEKHLEHIKELQEQIRKFDESNGRSGQNGC